MRGRFHWSGYLIIGLIAVGLLANLRSFALPLIVLGAIFLLYKFPPSRWPQLRAAFMSRSGGKGTAKEKRKPGKFRVIDGSKNPDADDVPKFH